MDGHLFKEFQCHRVLCVFPQGDVSNSTSRIVGNSRISKVTPERDPSDFHDIENIITKVCNSRVNRGGSPIVITKVCNSRVNRGGSPCVITKICNTRVRGGSPHVITKVCNTRVRGGSPHGITRVCNTRVRGGSPHGITRECNTRVRGGSPCVITKYVILEFGVEVPMLFRWEMR